MTEIKEKKDVNGIIKNLVDLVGATAGIILISIGSITFLNVFLKTYVFHTDGERWSRYNSIEERCEIYNPDTEDLNRALEKLGRSDNGYGRDIILEKKINEISTKIDGDDNKEIKELKKLTKEEKDLLKRKYDKCIKDGTEKREKNINNDRKNQMAWGLAFLIVGTPILLFYQRSRTKRKNKK